MKQLRDILDWDAKGEDAELLLAEPFDIDSTDLAYIYWIGHREINDKYKKLENCKLMEKEQVSISHKLMNDRSFNARIRVNYLSHRLRAREFDSNLIKDFETIGRFGLDFSKTYGLYKIEGIKDIYPYCTKENEEAYEEARKKIKNHSENGRFIELIKTLGVAYNTKEPKGIVKELLEEHKTNISEYNFKDIDGAEEMIILNGLHYDRGLSLYFKDPRIFTNNEDYWLGGSKY